MAGAAPTATRAMALNFGMLAFNASAKVSSLFRSWLGFVEVGGPVKWGVREKQGVALQKYGWSTPQIIHFNRVFHYKPSILEYPYFWKHPMKTWYFLVGGLCIRGLIVLAQLL